MLVLVVVVDVDVLWVERVAHHAHVIKVDALGIGNQIEQAAGRRNHNVGVGAQFRSLSVVVLSPADDQAALELGETSN